MRIQLAALVLAAGPAAAQPVPPEARLWLQCRACHSLKAGEAHKVGPNLAGVVGAKAAAKTDFGYSTALSRSGLTWDEATLDRWLERPAAVVPGTAMAYAGLPDPAKRQALIAYLKREAR